MTSPPRAPVSKRELYTVFAGLMLALTLASLDQNIVSTALPRIVSDLGGLAHLSWVVTAFLVTSTVTTPLYGKLSDIYGRKSLFIIAILIFLLGSILCGASQTMFQLILFRALQGLGAGGLMTLAQTTVGDSSNRAKGAVTKAFSAPSSPPAASPVLCSGVSSPTSFPGAGFFMSTCRSAPPHSSSSWSACAIPAVPSRIGSTTPGPACSPPGRSACSSCLVGAGWFIRGFPR
jgi:MFS family permease